MQNGGMSKKKEAQKNTLAKKDGGRKLKRINKSIEINPTVLLFQKKIDNFLS